MFMSIWLGYIETEDDPKSVNYENNIRNLIDEIIKIDDKIGDLEKQLIKNQGKHEIELKESDMNKFNQSNFIDLIDEVAANLFELDYKMEELEKEVGLNLEHRSGRKIEDNKLSSENLQMFQIDKVTDLQVYSNRRLIEHHIPLGSLDQEGNDSTIIQDLGRNSGTLTFKGLLTSKKTDQLELQKKVKTLQNFFNCQYPVYFASDFINQIDMSRAIIEDLRFNENTGSPYIMEFFCRLREYANSGVRDQYAELESKLQAQGRLYSEVQVLKIAMGYRNKFMHLSEKTTKSEVMKNIENGLIYHNISIKD
jgi:hypothetical protein